MYHELTYKDIARRRRNRIIAVILALLVAAAVVAGFFAYSNYVRVQGATSLRESILSSAKQCCAVEGSYPSSLAYLEQTYGLTFNHDDYVITYEWFADNVLPSVVVMPR